VRMDPSDCEPAAFRRHSSRWLGCGFSRAGHLRLPTSSSPVSVAFGDGHLYPRATSDLKETAR
jgi:hypothetical protein